MSSRVPSAARTLRVLRYLASRPSPASLEGIARSCDLPRSTAYHLLNTMIAEGFVEHFPDLHRFGLGVRAYEIGSGWSRQDPVQRLARVPLAGLVDRVGVSALLAVRREREIVLVQEDRAPEMPPLVVGEGRAPARSTVSGLVMLATLAPAALSALYPSPAAFVDRYPDGPSDLGSLRALLQQVRRRGHAEKTDHPHPGLVSVAVAVRVGKAPAPAAVVLVRPMTAATADDGLAEDARQSARAIAVLLAEESASR